MNKLEVIARVLSGVQRVLICGHVMPDGDSLGSVLALGLALRRLGKHVTMAGADPVPQLYTFLPGIEQYRAGGTPEGDYDTLIVLDCPVPERLGPGYQDLIRRDLQVINIDHHASDCSFGEYRYIDPKAAAVGEIVYDLLGLMKVGISLDVAICLYTAIVTDTGSFQYESTTPGTHLRVARLLETGIPVARINAHLYEEKPKVAQLLLSASLKTLSFSRCGKVAWMIVTRDMLRNAGARDEHVEGFVNYARSVKGVEVGLLFHELPGGRCKISFRSKEAVDVNHLALLFGGGGHSRAAGCEIADNWREIENEVVAAAIEATRGIRP